MALVAEFAPDIQILDPGLTDRSELERVHAPAYIDLVQKLSGGDGVSGSETVESGFGSGDNPPFAGMYEASLAYVGGSVAAARAVYGGANLAFNWSGGLHHARRSQASGFCIFNDCAVACAILRDKFAKVAYVDIDLHHGDGVQWLFYDDPTVMTCSIHESGAYLYPGTGFVEETGADLTSVNAPLHPMTTGDTWLVAFRDVILARLREFQPEAIVLQMGADPHTLDPLGHLQLSVQEWLEAVSDVRALDVPIVALGGGGYEKTTVPRMWTAATLTLLGRPVPPDSGLLDAELPLPRWQGIDECRRMIDQHHHVFAKIK